MKKIALLLTLLSLSILAGSGQTIIHPVKKDTVRTVKSKKKHRVVNGREARMRLQLQQIKQHKKQLKNVDSVQKELNKELHRTNQQDSV